MAEPDNTSTSERLARLAARGRATGTGIGIGPSPLAPSSSRIPAGNAPPVAVVRSIDGTPWPQPAITTMVPAATAILAPQSNARFRRAGGPGPRRRKHHPARRSRLAAASMSASMLVGGIAVLAINDSYASTAPAAGTPQGDLGTSADPEATLAPDALQSEDPRPSATTIGAAKATLAPGTLPPTVPPTPTAAAAAATPTTATAIASASATTQAAPAADEAAPSETDAAQAEPDPTEVATVAPRVVQRPAATRAPRPRCTGSKC